MPCRVCRGGFGGAVSNLVMVTAAKLVWLPGPSPPTWLTRALLHLLLHGKQTFAWLSD